MKVYFEHVSTYITDLTHLYTKRIATIIVSHMVGTMSHLCQSVTCDFVQQLKLKNGTSRFLQLNG